MKAEQLRKSILQLAIQGKLVPQDPADEPASVLLERIRAEKQRLIKEGKIKKDKGDSIIFKGDDNCYYEKTGLEVKNITDEIDFDLPDGWVFARINSLFFIQTGASFKKEQATSDVTQTRILRGGNILQGEYRFFENDIFVDSKLIQDSIILKNNDLITPAVTSIENIGKLARIEKDYEDVTAGGFVFIVRPCYNSDIFAKYMLYALQSSYFNKQLKSITKKSGQAFYNLGKERFIQLIIPIPPLNEQVRIVESIEQFTPLIAEYDKLEHQATKLDGEIYDKLKKSILQYAIQGKLVPQDSNEEPAAVLLERIRAEKKVQLGKKYVESYIYKGDDNCYYEHINGKDVDITEELLIDIPDNWQWRRIKNLFFVTKLAGFEYTNYFTKSAITQTNEVPIVRAQNVKMNKFIENTQEFISLELSELLTRSSLTKDCLLMTFIGAGIGDTCLYSTSKRHHLAPNVAKLEPYSKEINLRYCLYWLMSPVGQQCVSNIKKMTAQPSLSMETIRSIFIAVPPFAEQKRIVEKIGEIFAKL